MALAVVATLPVLGLGIAYVKFGPLWRRSDTSADPEILFAALEALKREFGLKRRLLVRVMPPAETCKALGERGRVLFAAARPGHDGLLLTPKRTDTDGFFVSVLRRA
jgi:hypothetical protein